LRKFEKAETMSELFPIADIEEIKRCLLKRNWTIGVAESVTAGLIQAALSQAESARRIFQGGMTVYNIGQKCRQLGIEPIYAEECNAVSPGIARQMAEHIADVFCSQVGVGITGYAAPVPEKGIGKPFAYVCIYGEGRLLQEGRMEHQGDPFEVQLYYMRQAVSLLRHALELVDKSGTR
jgi:PncC family amidohydrolase